jgi:hypothetical protein
MSPRPSPLRTALLAAAAAVIAGAAGTVSAQAFLSQNFIKPGDETLTLNLGGIVNQFNTSLQLNGSTGNGTNLDLENNGLARNLTTFEAFGTYRFLSRNRIDFQYFAGKRSGTKTYDTELNIDGNVYPLGATVSAEAKNQFFAADYRYSFVKSDNVEVAGLLGFYGGNFKFNIDATATSNGATKTGSTSSSTTVPLPLVGLTLDYYVNPRWKFSANVEGIKARIGDVDGSMLMAGALTDYMLTRNLGIGVRYMYSDLSVDVTKSSFNGSIDWKSSAVSLYAKLLY